MAKLIFRYGTMGCGKSTHLLQVLDNYKRIDKTVVLMKPEIDTKGNRTIVSRLGVRAKCDFLIKKDDSIKGTILFLKSLYPIDAVLIDEAQFLTKDQVDQLLFLTTQGVDVLCYGLRTNFRTSDKGFEGATRLLQLSHDVEEIKMMCRCGRKALFNTRFLNDKIVIDGPDVLIDDGKTQIQYVPLCASCFYQELNKSDKTL